jgi:hypothetical protein
MAVHRRRLMTTEKLLDLVEAAGFIFTGRAIPGRATEAHGDRENAVAVQVHQVLRSPDVLGDLEGTDVIVVGERPQAIREGGSLLLFTSIAAVGDRLVTRELEHREPSDEAIRDVAEAVRTVGERPLVQRVTEAELIVVGEAVDSTPIERPGPPRSEHDPEWWIARVAVRSVVKGATRRRRLEVLFANSEDIAWYKAPKLHEGTSGLLLLRPRDKAEAPAEVAETVYQATDPLDLLPVQRLPEVERILEPDRRDD